MTKPTHTKLAAIAAASLMTFGMPGAALASGGGGGGGGGGGFGNTPSKLCAQSPVKPAQMRKGTTCSALPAWHRTNGSPLPAR